MADEKETDTQDGAESGPSPGAGSGEASPSSGETSESGSENVDLRASDGTVSSGGEEDSASLAPEVDPQPVDESASPTETPAPEVASILASALAGTSTGDLAKGQEVVRRAVRANGGIGPLRSGILFATPAEWRPMIAAFLERIESIDDLTLIMAWLSGVWNQGYDVGHADATRGRYFHRPAPPAPSSGEN